MTECSSTARSSTIKAKKLSRLFHYFLQLYTFACILRHYVSFFHSIVTFRIMICITALCYTELLS